jgi:hypothetical protein
MPLQQLLSSTVVNYAFSLHFHRALTLQLRGAPPLAEIFHFTEERHRFRHLPHSRTLEEQSR